MKGLFSFLWRHPFYFSIAIPSCVIPVAIIIGVWTRDDLWLQILTTSAVVLVVAVIVNSIRNV